EREALEMEVGDVRVDPRRRAAWRGGRELDLTSREFDLLEALALHGGMVLTRQQLLEQVWGYTFDVQTNVVEVFVGYLRRKLNAALQSGGELARFVVDGATRLQFGARPPTGVPWPVAPDAGRPETVTVGGHRYRALSLPLRAPPGGGSGTLQVATPLASVESR